MNNVLGEFIFNSKYARYDHVQQRKETFEESIDRIFNMHIEHLTKRNPSIFDNKEFSDMFYYTWDLAKQGKIYGSQRALQFGGNKILDKNAKLYNCSYSYANRIEFFGELLWILLCGCGVGCSVHTEHISSIPSIIGTSGRKTVVIDDSIEGWADAIHELMLAYTTKSEFPEFDYSKIRPKGSMISGGFIAPGPDGLKNSIDSIIKILNNAVGRQLKSVEVYSINCHLADSVLSGGVRRCLAKDSAVETKNGIVAIQDINVGDYVKTANGYKQVVNFMHQGVQNIINISYEINGVFKVLRCTENHRVKVTDGWKLAGELSLNDTLITLNSENVMEVISILGIVRDGDSLTYDIEVEDEHSFICEGVLVHNSALSTLFDPNDEEMKNAKTGNWFITNPHYARSNNSMMFVRDETTYTAFSDNFETAKEFGEPGFAFIPNNHIGYNPCFEIAMEPRILGSDGNYEYGWQFCNLSTISGKDMENETDFYAACETIAFLGTIQASYDSFPYLGKTTENIVKKDALLGVSISGMMNNATLLLNEDVLKNGADIIKKTNNRFAKILGINPATRTTCIKPR